MSDNKTKGWPSVSHQLIVRLDEFTAAAIPTYKIGMSAEDCHAALAYHAGMKYMVDKLRVQWVIQAQKDKQTSIRTQMEG